MLKLAADTEPGKSRILTYGEEFNKPVPGDSVPPPPTPKTLTAPIGERHGDSAAAVRGENRHNIMALFLSGIPLEKAQRLIAAEPEQWKEAQTMFDSPRLQELLSLANSDEKGEVLVEREFALNAEVIRPDLVLVSETEVWIIDYKTGRVIPERHLPQLQRYAQAVSPHYPGRECHLAILDVRGKFHPLEP